MATVPGPKTVVGVPATLQTCPAVHVVAMPAGKGRAGSGVQANGALPFTNAGLFISLNARPCTPLPSTKSANVIPGKIWNELLVAMAEPAAESALAGVSTTLTVAVPGPKVALAMPAAAPVTTQVVPLVVTVRPLTGAANEQVYVPAWPPETVMAM